MKVLTTTITIFFFSVSASQVVPTAINYNPLNIQNVFTQKIIKETSALKF